MGLLDEDANVYKLIGPALIKQDPVEAKSNVETRLNLIKGELSRLESQAKSVDEKRSQKQQQVVPSAPKKVLSSHLSQSITTVYLYSHTKCMRCTTLLSGMMSNSMNTALNLRNGKWLPGVMLRWMLRYGDDACNWLVQIVRLQEQAQRQSQAVQ
jgi:hypothetical protein